MSEHKRAAERRHVFRGQDGPPDVFSGDAFAMRLMPPATRFSLRMDATVAQTAGKPAGFDLAQPINGLCVAQAGVGSACLSARLGPDEWLLIADGDDTNAGALVGMLDRDLGDRAYTLVDISHRNLALETIGDAAADVLNCGCPLDLRADAFPVGSVTRTLFAKSEIVLMRIESPDHRALFRIECWRSFGRYVHAHLRDAATLIGANGR